MVRGISTNRNVSSIAGDLHGAQIAFVCRYYSYTTAYPQKRLTLAEAQNLVAANLGIVAVYEDGPTDKDYFSAARGQQDAKHAFGYAQAIGQPSGSAIYFAVDYDAASNHVNGPITDYFNGVKAALVALGQGKAPYQIGVYGSGRVCGHIKDTLHLAQYAWLAESHGWADHATCTQPDIRQEISTSPLCTLACGTNGAYEDNFASGNYGAFARLDATAGLTTTAAPAAMHRNVT